MDTRLGYIDMIKGKYSLHHWANSTKVSSQFGILGKTSETVLRYICVLIYNLYNPSYKTLKPSNAFLTSLGPRI